MADLVRGLGRDSGGDQNIARAASLVGLRRDLTDERIALSVLQWEQDQNFEELYASVSGACAEEKEEIGSLLERADRNATELAAVKAQVDAMRGRRLGLLEVSGCRRTDRVGDVIFVHGLEGDAVSTWCNTGDSDRFWPRWLGRDVERIGVWSLGYEVSATAWTGRTMPLVDRALNSLAQLATNGIGKRPLIFVTHSLGGLLVKQMLRHARERQVPEWTAIADHTRGVVFLSTPHSGSNIANWVARLAAVLRLSVSVTELRTHDVHLRDLNDWYRDNIDPSRVKMQAYCETRPLGISVVVDQTSANPGIRGVPLVPMDDDHVTIAKPSSRQSLQYSGVLQLVRQCLDATWP